MTTLRLGPAPLQLPNKSMVNNVKKVTKKSNKGIGCSKINADKMKTNTMKSSSAKAIPTLGKKATIVASSLSTLPTRKKGTKKIELSRN